MSIAGDLIRGHTDAIILARLLRSDSYGYEINKVISTLSGGRFELKQAIGGNRLHCLLLGRQRAGGPEKILFHYPCGTPDLPASSGGMAGNQGYYG